MKFVQSISILMNWIWKAFESIPISFFLIFFRSASWKFNSFWPSNHWIWSSAAVSTKQREKHRTSRERNKFNTGIKGIYNRLPPIICYFLDIHLVLNHFLLFCNYKSKFNKSLDTFTTIKNDLISVGNELLPFFHGFFSCRLAGMLLERLFPGRRMMFFPSQKFLT